MVTLATSAYFLTCCRPIYNSFCFYIEKPKLIDLSHYPKERNSDSNSSICNHRKIKDHCLVGFNSCTDSRAWSLDDNHKRGHFLDIVSERIPQCGTSDTYGTIKEEQYAEKDPKRESEGKGENDKPKEKPKQEEDLLSETEPIQATKKDKFQASRSKSTPEELSTVESEIKVEEKPSESREKEFEVGDEGEKTKIDEEEKPSPIIEDEKKSEIIEKSKRDVYKSASSAKGSEVEEESEYITVRQVPSEKSKPAKDVGQISDDIINKLDNNLGNLENTIDKFVKKNRDFIQNLIACLNFEKQKQDALRDSYDKLKQENDILRTKNEYLKMVNTKQLELFRNELDKGISENKSGYKKRIHQLEQQLQMYEDELQFYKQNERKHLENVENEKREIQKLRNELKHLRSNETKLLTNYVKVLNFLEDIKETLSNSVGGKEPPHKNESDIITDSGPSSELKRVLRNALNNGIKSLNVRDLSILHDALQELDGNLCHQNGFCGKTSVTNLSCMDGDEYPVNDYTSKDKQGYDTSSNLSIYPSRQRPSHPYC